MAEATLRACRLCGATFHPYRDVQVFCSARCRHKAKTGYPDFAERRSVTQARYRAGRLVTVTCVSCGRSFEHPHTVKRCKECRAPRPKPTPTERTCEWCGAPFIPRGRQKCCSTYCTARAYDRDHRPPLGAWPLVYSECSSCGALKVRAAHHRHTDLCQPCARAARKSRDRSRRRGATTTETFTLREIADRDGWICHLCGKHVADVEYNYRRTDPTLDHLIPVSEGGRHERSNVRLAHMACNSARSTGGSVQLLLIG